MRASGCHGHVGIERFEQTRLTAADLADNVHKLALLYFKTHILESYKRVAVDGYISIVYH